MSRRAFAFDLGVAVVLAVIAFAEAAGHADDGYRGTAPGVVGGLVAGLAPLPLAFRRSHPLMSAAGVAALGSLPHLVLSYDVVSIGGLGPLIVAAEGAARYGWRPVNRWALLFPVPGLALLSATISGFADQVAVYAAAIGIGWTVGVLIRALVEQREALAGELVARQTMERLLGERAVAAERARIARDLHDVVAHCVSVMVLQSGAARLRVDIDAAGAETAIAHVEATGREALVELQRVLGVLRGGPSDDSGVTLTRLDRLAEQLGTAGLAVETRVHGDISTLPPGLDRSLYRVAQESLTNALKHGTGRSAAVALTVTGDRIELEVRNATRPSGQTDLPGGNGQIGMRERVTAYGGRLTTEAAEGEYRVLAQIPWPPAAL